MCEIYQIRLTKWKPGVQRELLGGELPGGLVLSVTR